MNNMTTLGEVATRVDNMSKHCFDQTINVPDIRFDDLETVRIDGSAHRMRTLAQRSICYRLAIPHHYLKKCPSDVQAYNLNHWIEKEKVEKLFFRFNGDDVRSIFSMRYVPVDNFEVMTQLDGMGYSPDTEVQCHLDNEFMLLNIPNENKELTIKAKDKLRPGISIRNSEVGLSSLAISAFILRLICTNGLVSKVDIGGSACRHISSKVLEQFPIMMSEAAAAHNIQGEQFKLSLKSEVSNPELTMESFNRQFQLNELERQAVD